MTVAVRVTVSVALRLALVLLRTMDLTGTPLTDTIHSAFTPDPSTAAAVIVVVPIPVAVIKPLEDTVAISGLELVHSNSLVDAKVGCTSALSCHVSPTIRLRVELSSVILCTKARSVVTLVVVFSSTNSLPVAVENILFFNSILQLSATSLFAVM